MRKGVFNIETGELEIIYRDGEAIPPQQDMTGRDAVDVPAGYPDTKAWDAQTRSFVGDLSALTKDLFAQIDATREHKQMTALTRGAAKAFVYGRKAAEAIDAQSFGTVDTLDQDEKMRRFPFAASEAAITGDELSAVLGRFSAGMNAAAAENARIEAVAQKAKCDIRAATTASAKRRIFCAIDWAWPS